MNTSTLTLPDGSSIMLVPLNQPKTDLTEPMGRNKQIQLRSKSLLALSIINIILWTISTLLQVGTLVAFNGGLFSFYRSGWDVGGWGIWCSLFYAISGFTGYSASYTKKRPLIITSLVFAVFSLATSAIAASFAGIQAVEASYGYRCSYFDPNSGSYMYRWYECGVWGGIEWALMSISILAFTINLSVVVITSMAICNCCNRKKSNSHQAVLAPVPSATVQYSIPTVVPYSAPLSPVAIQQPIFNPTTQQQNYAILNQQAYPLQQQLQQQQQPEGLLQLPVVSETPIAAEINALTIETEKHEH